MKGRTWWTSSLMRLNLKQDGFWHWHGGLDLAPIRFGRSKEIDPPMGPEAPGVYGEDPLGWEELPEEPL